MIPLLVKIEPFLFQSLWIVFTFRFFFNMFVYFMINSEVINEFNRGFGDSEIEESLHYIFTFWFPVELFDSRVVKILKKVANTINISFALLVLTSLFVWTSRPR